MPATTAQKRFAQGMALGKSQSVAYKIAHPTTKMTGKSLATTAQIAAKNRNVKDELARLMKEPLLSPLLLFPFPEYQDAARLREHAVATMFRLTNHEDPVVAMHAAIWVFDYSKALDEQRKPKVKVESRAEILASLRATYARNLARQAPLVIEVAPSDSDDVAPWEDRPVESAAAADVDVVESSPAESSSAEVSAISDSVSSFPDPVSSFPDSDPGSTPSDSDPAE
jgi:hypothetical protein